MIKKVKKKKEKIEKKTTGTTTTITMINNLYTKIKLLKTHARKKAREILNYGKYWAIKQICASSIFSEISHKNI